MKTVATVLAALIERIGNENLPSFNAEYGTAYPDLAALARDVAADTAPAAVLADPDVAAAVQNDRFGRTAGLALLGMTRA